MDAKFEKVPDDSPDRCQSVFGNGQCQFKVIPGSSYCLRHGGHHVAIAERKKSRNAYNLAVWQSRVDDFADDEAVKSLRAEIGITRMLLEATLNNCKNPNQLLMHSTKIGDLVLKIERLVVSCSRLETTMGMTLGRETILDLATKLVGIVGENIDDPEIVSRIGDEFVKLIIPPKAS